LTDFQIKPQTNFSFILITNLILIFIEETLFFNFKTANTFLRTIIKSSENTLLEMLSHNNHNFNLLN
jgi:hypothetical protein